MSTLCDHGPQSTPERGSLAVVTSILSLRKIRGAESGGGSEATLVPAAQRRKLRTRGKRRACPRLKRKGVHQAQEGLCRVLHVGKLTMSTAGRLCWVLGVGEKEGSPSLDKSKGRCIGIQVWICTQQTPLSQGTDGPGLGYWAQTTYVLRFSRRAEQGPWGQTPELRPTGLTHSMRPKATAYLLGKGFARHRTRSTSPVVRVLAVGQAETKRVTRITPGSPSTAWDEPRPTPRRQKLRL